MQSFTSIKVNALKFEDKFFKKNTIVYCPYENIIIDYIINKASELSNKQFIIVSDIERLIPEFRDVLMQRIQQYPVNALNSVFARYQHSNYKFMFDTESTIMLMTSNNINPNIRGYSADLIYIRNSALGNLTTESFNILFPAVLCRNGALVYNYTEDT